MKTKEQIEEKLEIIESKIKDILMEMEKYPELDLSDDYLIKASERDILKWILKEENNDIRL